VGLRFLRGAAFAAASSLSAFACAAEFASTNSLLLNAIEANEGEMEIDVSSILPDSPQAAAPTISAGSTFRSLLPASLVLDQSIEWNPLTAVGRFFEQLDEGSWITGAEATFMQVDADSHGRINLSFDDSDTAGTDYRGIAGEGFEASTVAPRIWAGRQLTPKWAIVVRYWEVSEAASTTPDSPPGQVNLPNFATLEEFRSLSMSTFDIEGVRSFTVSGFKLDASVGGRHATHSYRNSIEAFGVFTTGNFVNMDLSNGGSFEGDGVTYALTARRQIFDLPAYLFVSGRGSSLVGTSDTFARAIGTVASAPSSPLVGAATVRRNNAEASATIAEFQAGLQVEQELQYIPAVAFFRAAFEYQYWNINALNVGGAGFGGTIGDLTTNSFSRINGDPSVKMMGLALATGLTW